MNSKGKTGIAIAAVLAIVVIAWISTAPYPGNTGWQRMPGVILGGTDTPTPADFTSLICVARRTLPAPTSMPCLAGLPLTATGPVMR